MEVVEVRYKNTDVGVIPTDWIVSDVGNAFEICNNLRLPISQEIRESIKGQYPYYGPTKIQDYIDHYRIEGKYALIGEDGDHFLKWDKMPMTQLVEGRFNVNNHAHVVKGGQDASTEWFYFFFSNRDITKHLTRQGAGRYKLTKSSLMAIPCAFPPTLNEQSAIVTALSDVDALIASLDRLIEKKKAIKQGAMQELLTGKTRLAGFGVGVGYKMTEVGRIPEDWEVYTVNDLIDLLTDYDANGSCASVAENVKVYDNEEYAWYVRSTDLENNSKMNEVRYVDKLSYDFLKKTSLHGGELLFLKRGDIGKVYLFEMKTKRATVAPNLYLLKLNSISFSTYLYYFFLSNAGQSQLLSKNASTTLGALYKDDVKSVYVPLSTNRKEQEHIANAISDMDAKIRKLEGKKDKYIQIKQGMMQELLTGKTRLV
ncbi:MAG: restriction endonuclease subunit S [Bacteroidota bacterium]